MDQEIYHCFWNFLHQDITDARAARNSWPKLFSHYTSLGVLESIIKHNEIWFSHPLMMNDLQELKYGVEEATRQVFSSNHIDKACGDAARASVFKNAYNYFLNDFYSDHSLDIYVFCVSDHDPRDTDGILSMWRGYGKNGDGAAIIFDVEKLGDTPSSCIVIDEVQYASQTERQNWIAGKISSFSEHLATKNIATDKLYLAAHALFQRLRTAALFTKHAGFREEKEWRFVYLKERDPDGKMQGMLSYFVGERGIEPKLKLKVEPIEGHTSEDLSLSNIVKNIILGPSISTPLAMHAAKRILIEAGRPDLVGRLTASTIPLRSLRV